MTYRGVDLTNGITVYDGTRSVTLTRAESDRVTTSATLKTALETKAGRPVRTPIVFHRLRGGLVVLETGRVRTTAEVQADYDEDRKAVGR